VSRHQRRPHPGRLAIAHSTTFGATPRDPPMAHVGTAPVPPSVAHWPHHISAEVSENPGLPKMLGLCHPSPLLAWGTALRVLHSPTYGNIFLHLRVSAQSVAQATRPSSSSWARVTPSCFLTSWAFCETMPAHNESSPFRTNEPTMDVVRIGNASHTRTSHADCTRPTA
jgi:hypothetical protein